MSTEKKLATNKFVGAVKYNCEKSGGTFDTDMCSCPLEGDQTQEEMYDITTGYCQTTHGGPGGDAFYASVGLPYGYYSFWRDIVFAQCEATGGVVSGSVCICPEHTVYNTSNGQCNKE